MKFAMNSFSRSIYTALFLAGWMACSQLARAQDEAAPPEEGGMTEVLATDGDLIDFLRDVKPILDAKCVACHGPDDAKNDFRVDDQETMLAYLEPGDLESSSLWADYLVTDDPDMRMPPPGSDKVEQLSGAELATLRLWIEEGAEWAEADPADLAGTELAKEQAAAEFANMSTPQKIWRFQGLFHPASVHFPIALLTVSAGFVLLSFFRRESCEPVAFHCLWIGALGAVVACMAGWSYADYEGYKSGLSFDFQNSAIDRHRWLGIAVAGIALILVPIASAVRRNGDSGMRLMWLIASLLLVGGVSIVGYQGGELTYGEDHYWNEFDRLFADDSPAIEVDDSDAAISEPEVPSGDASNESESVEVLSDGEGDSEGDSTPDPESGTDPDSEPDIESEVGVSAVDEVGSDEEVD